MAVFAVVFWILLLASGISGRLLWSDEFNGESGTKPSTSKWRYDLGDGSSRGIPGWGNAERQYYTSDAKNCATDGHGSLVITAQRSKSTRKCYYGHCEYTSARLVSTFAQKYGYFEARIKTPSGKGVWPAFWMLGENIGSVGWPQCGEVDIMEVRGSEPNKNLGVIHGPGYSGGGSLSSTYTLKSGKSFSDDFHVFAVNFEPDRMTWLVDGEVYFTVSKATIPHGSQWVFNGPFTVLLNLAIGGHFDGNPNAGESFPKKLVVDYVRVYDHKPK